METQLDLFMMGLDILKHYASGEIGVTICDEIHVGTDGRDILESSRQLLFSFGWKVNEFGQWYFPTY